MRNNVHRIFGCWDGLHGEYTESSRTDCLAFEPSVLDFVRGTVGNL